MRSLRMTPPAMLCLLLLTVLSAGALPLSADANARLWHAVTNNDARGVRRALAAGANANYVPHREHEMNVGNLTVLFDAMEVTDNHDIVKLLLEHGARADIVFRGGPVEWALERGVTPLISAVSGLRPPDAPPVAPTVKLLLEYGAGSTINNVDVLGRTALTNAAEHLDYRSIELLLEAGADPTLDPPGKYGQTAMEAIEESYDRCRKLSKDKRPATIKYYFPRWCGKDWKTKYKRSKKLLKEAIKNHEG